MLGLLGLVSLTIAAAGCSRRANGPAAESKSQGSVPQRISVIATGSVAGFVEPCGCVKDQLGGLDRFATAVQKARASNPALLVEVGALFFPRAELDAQETTELSFRADTLATVFHSLGAFAWVPTPADNALGAETLARLVDRSHLRPLPQLAQTASAQNRTAPTPARTGECATTVVGSVRVGVCGTPGRAAQQSAVSVVDQLRAQATQLSAQGASLRIALLDTDAGSALRAADRVPEFHLMIVSGGSGDSIGADTDGAEPVRAGQTLVVQPANHLRAIVTIDFTIRDSQFVFEDGTGIGRDSERNQVAERIRELSERLSLWQRQNLNASVLKARRQDLSRLQARERELSRPVAVPSGSYFTLRTIEIGSNVPSDPKVRRTLDELGRRINDNNREKFAGRKAPEPEPGQAGFVGVGVCETCHDRAAQFWRQTRHSRAYQTLVNVEREFTLDCVGCHVTGYEMPGGSTVTDVAGLKNVQCENCHGPGSIHAKTRATQDIRRVPPRELCAQRCHHSPHVAASWSVNDAWPKIVGPGHGQ